VFAGQIVSRGRVRLVEHAEPELGEAGGEILFAPKLACLCGSDMPFFDGAHEYPLDPGFSLHEMIGTVVGTTGERFREGDEVLAVPIAQQGFFERYPLGEQRAIPVDPRCSPHEAVLAQPLGTVLYALRKVPHLLDRNVVVLGQGPMGNLFCAALRNAGARQIIAVDRLSARLRETGRMGATTVIDAGREDPVSVVGELTGGIMADVVIECVGHEHQAFNECVELCRRGGYLLYFGVPPETIDGVAWRKAFYKNLTIQTSVDPDFERDFPLAMRWIAEKRIDVTPLVTHTFALGEVQTAYETFRDRRDGALKVFLDMTA
jgi:threonine dehydrogenase-like Zn-dependent dehydrogenase